MAKQITTTKKLVADLENLAARSTFYSNEYPFNLCYVYANGQVSADCVNLYKSLLNGYNVEDTTAGYFQRNLSNTGDCTEWGLMKQATDVTTDFSRITKEPNWPRLLYKEGHIGGFIGKEVEIYGNLYNCIEATAWVGDWGHSGIIYTWVDPDGSRRNHKGGYTNGAWTYNGLMTPWVDYAEEAEDDMTFSDVTDKTPGHADIEWAAENGIVKGFADGTFRPEGSVTRAQMCIMLHRLYIKMGGK